MTWFKVDDSLAFHGKTVQAGNAAMGLWVRAGSWSAQQLTDGFVPEHIVTVLGTAAQAKRLVKAGLWHETDGGYVFHEWTDDSRNPTRSEILERRAKESERKSKAREAKSAKAQVTEPSPEGTPADVPGGVPAGVRSTRPVPSRPDPVPTDVGTEGRARERATRIPDDFDVTDEMIAWAREHTPDVGRVETDKFVDYWRSKSGKDATKRDWVATWRNWMRRAQESAPRQHGASQHQPAVSKRDEKALNYYRMAEQLAGENVTPLFGEQAAIGGA